MSRSPRGLVTKPKSVLINALLVTYPPMVGNSKAMGQLLDE